MNEFSERLKQVFDYKGFTKYSEFAEKTGIGHQTVSNYLKGNRKPDAEQLKKIKQAFGDIDAEWLLTGEGNMIFAYPNSYSKEKQLGDNKVSEGVPYYGTDITSSITGSFSDMPEEPEFYINIPPLNDCSAWFTNRGDSMFPKYRSGQVLGVKTVKNFDAILWGESYLVITNAEANELKTVKNVHPHDEEDRLILRSSNPNYKGDTVVLKKNIISMHLIKANLDIIHN